MNSAQLTSQITDNQEYSIWHSDKFHNWIRELYLLCLSDKNILQILENEGYKITEPFLIHIQKKLKLKNHIDLIDKEIADEMLSS
jgi:phosphoketolase